MKADIFLNSQGWRDCSPRPSFRRTVAQSLLREEWVVSNLSRRGGGGGGGVAPPHYTTKKGRGKGARGFPVIAPACVAGANRAGGTDSHCSSPELLTVRHLPRLQVGALRLQQ